MRPYIVIPNLVQQPTWGGSYIIKYKKIVSPELSSKKIGQSYELYEASSLSRLVSTESNLAVELSDPINPEKVKKFYKSHNALSIKDLIFQNPQGILGNAYLKKFGPKIRTLIKLNQAKGNSYQLHVNHPVGKWLPKPESWYFLENGLVTLGAKPRTDWDQYKDVCEKIDAFGKKLSQKVKNKQLPLSIALEQLQAFITQNNPRQFVNVLEVKKGQAIDLSREGGIHHSWEEDENVYPQGNIVYEIQENVYDDASTLRSFDKGKMKEDGSVRELQIHDYFQYANRNSRDNKPEKYVAQPELINQLDTSLVEKIFTTKRYTLHRVQLSKQHIDATDGSSFHHLFVESGKVQLKTSKILLTITPGFSVFIPADTGVYELFSDTQYSKNGSHKTVILKTFYEKGGDL